MDRLPSSSRATGRWKFSVALVRLMWMLVKPFWLTLAWGVWGGITTTVPSV